MFEIFIPFCPIPLRPVFRMVSVWLRVCSCAAVKGGLRMNGAMARRCSLHRRQVLPPERPDSTFLQPILAFTHAPTLRF
ncbi:hypothetical protein C7444_105125 [Sphaerotilus hippei]|uniref:Uncharacterized protein n=1 Tax=Sphaerotilus hippei TaxID=744406 RepID=A0A318H4Q0_9BURK|nr:hypothetical protein [Sphaerotilus hippei]PXW97026.1 hypothetical protein C7444_105125 [Sphaerotilus hippei]